MISSPVIRWLDVFQSGPTLILLRSPLNDAFPPAMQGRKAQVLAKMLQSSLCACSCQTAYRELGANATCSHSPGLESDLNRRLHGQHLARKVILRAVRGFLQRPQPEKALALSFHGWSGTGKNFVARMIADHLYRDGLKSECVKVFISLFHFPHPVYLDSYKVRAGQICCAGTAGESLTACSVPNLAQLVAKEKGRSTG